MAQCYQNAFEFPRGRRRAVQARLEGGEITSDGGSLLLRQADRYLGLTEAVAQALSDHRRRKSCIRDAHALVRQRVYAVALGYEDLNDHDELGREVGLQTAVERDRPLANASTLCRFENRAGRSQSSNGSCAWQCRTASRAPPSTRPVPGSTSTASSSPIRASRAASSLSNKPAEWTGNTASPIQCAQLRVETSAQFTVETNSSPPARG